MSTTAVQKRNFKYVFLGVFIYYFFFNYLHQVKYKLKIDLFIFIHRSKVFKINPMLKSLYKTYLGIDLLGIDFYMLMKI